MTATPINCNRRPEIHVQPHETAGAGGIGRRCRAELGYAAAAAGGGMPYSGFLGTFKTDHRGNAAIICVVAIVAGVAAYIFACAFDGILLTIIRVAIGCAIIGSAVTMLTTMGVTGAIV